MDLETENRIASILLREAAELRRQADKEGVRAYLEKPNVRHRPNSRFLTATVLGVQQGILPLFWLLRFMLNTRVHICLVRSLMWLLPLRHAANKAVETDEMWRLRSAEIEFDERLKRKSREESSGSGQSEQGDRRSFVKRCTSVDENVAGSSSSSSSQSRNKRWQPDGDDGKGLGDVEVETFLQSRVKRGRGSVGPKMDEPFPCLPVPEPSRTTDTGDRKLVSQPEKRPILRHHTDSSSSSDDEVHERSHRKRKEHKQKLSKSKRHKSKEKQRDRKEKRRDEKKRKHGRD
ncbi:hypothetical protein F2Q70_00034000 [Brassica cretica]|uniref:Uncharacterized protein n=1 Tax=Brassica cretica TaxID=69181 RepID=A0A8S9JUQ2_BRACR|nr:hypothetical protein F2Q70_00034000 [Brassica cretica]